MDEVAIRLCPQAWPIPGKASYSALYTTTRPPVPTSQEKAVGTPKAWGVTSKLRERRRAIMLSCAWNSSYANSGLSKILLFVRICLEA
jgi:hypothetical protein